MSGSGATTVSNLSTNANNVNGPVGTLVNYNTVFNSIAAGAMTTESVRVNRGAWPCKLTCLQDAIQIKIATCKKHSRK